MKFKIHRGTKEIGGSCVEVWTENTRILIDFGMPLVEKDGREFDFRKYKTSKPNELVEKGAWPPNNVALPGQDLHVINMTQIE